MKKTVLAAAFAAVAFLVVAAKWTDYPFVTSPAGSETLLVGDASTNHQWAISNMYVLTRSNANRGMQAGSQNLTNWSELATSDKQDSSANLDLWSAVVPSSYQPILGYTPQVHSANLDTWSGRTIDGVTIVDNGGVLSAVGGGGGSGNVNGPVSSTDGNFALWNGTTGGFIKNSAFSPASFALAGITNGWPWQALNQPLTANGIAWSLLATSAKQDASANLTGWSALATSAKQDHSVNLDSWSALATSAKQDALGFTPLTSLQSFQQASNLVLTLTVPLDQLSFSGAYTLFAVGPNTNPVPVHLGTGLAFDAATSNLNVTVSGGTASALPFTNIWPASSNIVLIDLAKSKDWNIGQITNNPYRFTNVYNLTNLPRTAMLNFHGSTNGTFAPTFIDVSGGVVKSNNSSWFPTNASAEATMEVQLDWTMTNLISLWRTNFSPTTASTNSSTGGGGGGGGGTWTLIGSASGDTFDANGCNSSAHPLNATGANLLVAVTSYLGGSIPSDFTNSAVANTWTLTSGQSSSPKVVCQYVISPNVSSSMVFTNPIHSGTKNPFVVYAFARAGGAPTFGTEAVANYFDWRAGGTPAGTANGASVTPFGSSDLILSGIAYDTDGSTTLSVDSGFTKVALIPISAGGSPAACAAYKIKSASSSAEDPGWSWSSATPFATISIDNITFH